MSSHLLHRRHCRSIVAILFAFILASTANSRVAIASDCYTAIFSFGDSLADTGNDRFSGDMPPAVGKLPYGQTYFQRATGRFSDGRLLVDFIAQAVGLPLLRPYLAGGTAEDFRYGANFAVAGATALNNSFFEERGFSFDWTNYTLSVQIECFKELLRKLSSSTAGARHILSSSLVLMGEIGGNDYNYAFINKKTIDEIRTYVPSIIGEISSAITVLIELGAKTVVVPGNLPIGCAPCYLTSFISKQADEYDPDTGCIKWLNEFAEYHNKMLQDELDRIRERYPDVLLSYADYYGASMAVFRSPQLYGFESPLFACCGAGGPYNFGWSVWCGDEGTVVCNDSSKAFSWDGVHPTEAGYRAIVEGLMEGGRSYPSFLESCLHLQHASRELELTETRTL